MKNLELIYSRHNVGKPPLHSTLRHIPFNDLTIVLDGSLEYTVNGNKYEICGGDIIFISSGSAYVRKNTDEIVDYVSFNFNVLDEIHLPVQLKNAVHSEARLLIAAFDKIQSRSYLDNTEKISHLLACLISIFEDRVRAQSFNPLTLNIIKYIHNNLEEKITLEDIGRLTFFSPVYCDTVFKRETGKSIIDYLIDERIDMAKKLLLENTLPLSKISEQVGFNDYNYFSRVFKARSGYSPSAYRQMAFKEQSVR